MGGIKDKPLTVCISAAWSRSNKSAETHGGGGGLGREGRPRLTLRGSAVSQSPIMEAMIKK